MPSLIVVHYTAMPSATAARDWLCSPKAQVSAHYVIARSGVVWQLVSESLRAWHAGVGSWQGQCDVNSRSIGIELANTGFEPFPEPQMAALVALIGRIRARWAIPPSGVIGHSDFAPGRKVDPGPRFDWHRLAVAGQAIWPKADAPPCDGLHARLIRFGYPADISDDQRLAAFRLRFRPYATGPEDDTDRRLVAGLPLIDEGCETA